MMQLCQMSYLPEIASVKDVWLCKMPRLPPLVSSSPSVHQTLALTNMWRRGCANWELRMGECSLAPFRKSESLPVLFSSSFSEFNFLSLEWSDMSVRCQVPWCSVTSSYYSYELSRHLEPPVDLCSPPPWSQRTLSMKLSLWVSCYSPVCIFKHAHYTKHKELHAKLRVKPLLVHITCFTSL